VTITFEDLGVPLYGLLVDRWPMGTSTLGGAIITL
jgi:hypothetical protein